MIKLIKDKNACIECDKLLTLLINDEKQYDRNIDLNFQVNDYYYKIINNDKNTYLLGYFDNDKLIGYIFIKCFEIPTDKEYTGFIDALYVLEEYRNKGVATFLLKEAINLLKKNGIHIIDINVLFSNKKAFNLYKKIGFNEFKVTLRQEI